MSYIGNIPQYQAFVVDQFSGNGSTTAFTMSVAPAGTTNVLVAISGVLQDPATYGVVGNTLTFSAAPPSGTGNISCRYLGIPVTGVTTTAYRTVTEFTATASQTTFTPPSYTVGFINVYRNGVRLGSADYTATNGTTVVLANGGATSGDLVTTISFLVSSVLNAIPAVAGAVTNAYLGAISTFTTPTSKTVTLPDATGTIMVSGNMPAFSAYQNTAQSSISNGVTTKLTFDAEVFDTANCFASSRYTPNVAGYYQINAGMALLVASSSSYAQISIYKNGSSYGNGAASKGNDGTLYPQSVSSWLVYFNGSTDYVEAYVYCSGGVPVNNSQSTWFSGALVRTA